MVYFTTTRFNDETWEENMIWRRNNNSNGCIYGTPQKIKFQIPINSPVYVIEMNNDTNSILGIGLIRNKLELQKKHKIYSCGNYNRYTYKGHKRVDRYEMTLDEDNLCEKLDKLLFKGHRHLKRGQGITELPSRIIDNKDLSLKKQLKKMFINKYNGK